MKYKLDKNIPVPPQSRAGRKPSPFTQALESLQVGWSVFTLLSRKNVENAAQRTLGRGNYTIRKQHGGFRVWRTKP